MKLRHLILAIGLAIGLLIVIGCEEKSTNTADPMEVVYKNLPTGYYDMLVLYAEIINMEKGFSDLLSRYEAFRDSVPADIHSWPESIHKRNGQFNDNIAKVENLWRKKLGIYNDFGRKIQPDSLMAGNLALKVELPQFINIATDEVKTEEEKVNEILNNVNH